MRVTSHFKTILIVICFFVSVSFVQAAQVDTLAAHSDAMNMDIPVVVITPKDYSKKKEYPVVYLLHGYSGNYRDWVKNVPDVKNYADMYQMIIVCPDGGFGSWYLDSPVRSNSKYETFISSELIRLIDSKYSTKAERKGRAITGLSMGGHGAMYNALKHQDLYGAAGSMSGGVDIRPYPRNWELSELLGTYDKNAKRWGDHSVVELVNQYPPINMDLIIECGVDDFFYHVNVELHERLDYMKINHTFISSPGGHTWTFWENAVKYQLLHFNDYFKKQ